MAAKEAVNRSFETSLAEGVRFERRVFHALFATKDRNSPLGTYSIDSNGDTTLTEMALEGVENGQLKFIKVIKGSAL